MAVVAEAIEAEAVEEDEVEEVAIKARANIEVEEEVTIALIIGHYY